MSDTSVRDLFPIRGLRNQVLEPRQDAGSLGLQWWARGAWGGEPAKGRLARHRGPRRGPLPRRRGAVGPPVPERERRLPEPPDRIGWPAPIRARDEPPGGAG